VSADVQAQLAPSRVGQATAIEQSRAIAEVQAAIVVAQQCPRDVPGAVRAMRESCKQEALAERAFYAYPRAGQTISGASIHLARELARVWGNVQYGISELRRDDDFGQSEMIAFAWDVQTNARASSAFIVPHRRDTKDGPKALTDMRDIYESNANNGARRVREMIFSILPAWFTEDAKRLCAETISAGGGRPLAQQITDAVDRFGERGVSAEQLEARLGRPAAKWAEHDVVQLHVLYRSLVQGEIHRDEAFPPAGVTAGEVLRKPEVPSHAQPAGGSDSTAAGPVTAQAARAERPNPDIFHTDAETAALLKREGLRVEHETRPAERPDPTPAASGATGPSAATDPGASRGESQRQAALTKLDGMLKALPLGEPEDVAALLKWLTGADVTPELMTISQARTAYSQLDDFLKAADRDPGQAAHDIWTRYRELHDKPGGTDG
jgi:hypothetical protein